MKTNVIVTMFGPNWLFSTAACKVSFSNRISFRFEWFSHGMIFLANTGLITFLVYLHMGEAKVSCIWRHRDVQLLLAYRWARPGILAADKGRGRMFLFLVSSLSFIFHCPLSLSFISTTISSISLLSFSGRRHKITHKGWRVVKP